MATSENTRRAIGIVRVSRVGGRAGDRFVSPEIQRENIEAECERRGLHLIETLEELDVSGGKALDKRPRLSQALAAVEGGQAEAIVFAYRDRMDRSIVTGSELCERMDAAGGLLVAAGNVITHATHDGWRRSTFESFLNEDQRRAVGEKMQAVQKRCVAEGRPPWSRVALGYRRGADGRLEVEPGEVPIVTAAFNMRADGEALRWIRKMLQGHGVERSYRGIQVMLSNRIYLGELHFGKLVNMTACEPIIDRALFDRVARSFVPRGPKPKSPRLLSRLGVLRCGTCGARLSAMKMLKQGSDYAVYRCSSTADCDRHVAISADIAESVIVERVRAALADIDGRASAEGNVREAERALQDAEQALSGAVAMLSGLEDVEGTRERLLSLREARDEAQARLDQLGGAPVAITVNAATDWNLLTLQERRALIRATVESATVAPGGRGAGRITLKLFGEQTASSAV
jgi:site-specific DNA recombinase